LDVFIKEDETGMKKHLLRGIATMQLLLAACTAWSVPVDMSIEVETKVTSAYVWRGQVISDNPCLQPSITFGAGKFDLNLWGTLDLVEHEDTWERNRVDVTGSYTWEEGRQVVSAGVVGYVYHDGPRNTSRDTFEAFGSYGIAAPLLPSLTVYYDFDRIEGYYGSFSLQHSVEIVPDRAALDVGAFLGAADARYLNAMFDPHENEDDEEIAGDRFDEPLPVDLTVTLWMPIHLRPNVVVMPGAKYMTLLESDVRDAAADAGSENSKFSYSLSLIGYF